MALNVDLIATDAHLADHAGGLSNLKDIIPSEDEWLDVNGEKTAKKARQTGLDKVMVAMSRWRPAVGEDDLVDPTELRLAVCYSGLADLFMAAAQHADSPNMAKSKRFADLFKAELAELRPTLKDAEPSYEGAVVLSNPKRV